MGEQVPAVFKDWPDASLGVLVRKDSVVCQFCLFHISLLIQHITFKSLRYEQGWSKAKGFKAFSLISDKHIFSAELAITKGWDKPYTAKIEDPVKYGLLTPEEDDIRRGIVQLKDDMKRPKGERGG